MSAFRNSWALALLLAASFSTASAAEHEEAVRRFGDDLFAAGSNLRIAEQGLEDLLAAGRVVTVSGNLRESVHAIGRHVRIVGAVGQDAYAAGQQVEVRGPVTGDVGAAGEQVELDGSVGGDVALAGRQVEVNGPIGGDATLVGQVVEIAAPITGSAQVRAERIRFGPGARIDGTLAYWSPNAVNVPASVITPDRVTGVRVAERERTRPTTPRAVRFTVGLLVLLAFAAIFAAVLPRRLQMAQERVIERPWLSFLMGVIAASALFGSILVLLVSIIGIPLAPIVLVLAPFVLLAGYLTAAFVLGRLSLGLARVRPIEGRLGVFTAMATGLVLLTIVRLVPVLGWVVLVLAIVLGLGAWFMLLMRPRPAAA